MWTTRRQRGQNGVKSARICQIWTKATWRAPNHHPHRTGARNEQSEAKPRGQQATGARGILTVRGVSSTWQRVGAWQGLAARLAVSTIPNSISAKSVDRSQALALMRSPGQAQAYLQLSVETRPAFCCGSSFGEPVGWTAFWSRPGGAGVVCPRN